MSYYKVLGFEREPFSTSPDPEFFYESREHERALTNLMIELRLRRGLSVILGDVGTGKTTLCRKVIQLLSSKTDFIYHMVLDPHYESEEVFFASLARNFDISYDGFGPQILNMKEGIEGFLFEKGVEQNKVVVLVIDEAQKLSEMSLECLRVLLNYETNSFKLLQLVLLGQMELHSKIMNMANFLDRISFKYALNPLDLDEMHNMIDFRIRQAGYKTKLTLFLDDAIEEIHRHTRGYPRKVSMLCHKALTYLIMRNRPVVDKWLIQEIVEAEEVLPGWTATTPVLLQKSSC